MSYRVILALVAGQTEDRQTLAVACDLAKRFEAEARVLPSAADPAEALTGYGLITGGFLSAEFETELQSSRTRAMVQIDKETRDAADRAQIAFGEPARPQSAAHVVPPAVSPWLTLLNEAPFGDLAVIAHAAARDQGALSLTFTDALMDLRLPILIANGERSAVGGTAVVAWNGSMEAGRAVRAALPLLLQANRVLVMQRQDSIEWRQQDAAGVDRCVSYLKRHGVPSLESMLIEGRVESDAVMQAAKDAGADLLVAGAYGHPRWQEFLLGGFTRMFLGENEGPHLVISH